MSASTASPRIVEAVFTTDAACVGDLHVVLPSHAICECDRVTLNQVPHTVQAIQFRLVAKETAA